MKTLKKRWFFSSLVLAAVLGLSACAGPQVADYAAEKPVLDLRQYFNGTIDAYEFSQTAQAVSLNDLPWS